MEGMPEEGTGLPIVGEEIAGKYRIESIIGQGGMGAVYAARNVMTGKRVAIKWLLPEHAASNTRERLLREAQCAASIDHPNVVDIYDVGEHQGGLFLVMEYLKGKPLSDVLAERGRLDPEELIALLVPAMRGVHAAHQAGVIHRDLKPENILLSESDGQIVPKVVDFGVSKNVGASAMPNSSLTRTGALVGTPHYMALEQVDGSNAIDTRTDVYAFGVLLYRALTGHFPHDGSSLGEVILKIGTKDPPPMRMLREELPEGLDHVVLRALARDRTKRFIDLEELARALMPYAGWRMGSEQGESSGSVLFRPFGAATAESVNGASPVSSSRATPTPEQRGRKRRTVLIAGVAAAAVLFSGVWLTHRELAQVPSASPLPAARAQANEKSLSLTGASAARPEQVPTTLPAAAALTRQPDLAAAALVPDARSDGAPSDGMRADGVVDGKDEPSDGLQDSLQAADGKPADAPSSRSSGKSRADKSRGDSSRGDNARSKKSSSPSAGRNKSQGSSVIAGERTNGFSVDEF